PPTTQLHSPSLHDALPISPILLFPRENEPGIDLSVHAAPGGLVQFVHDVEHMERELPAGPMGAVFPDRPDHVGQTDPPTGLPVRDRKSTRLNSSHVKSSYA